MLHGQISLPLSSDFLPKNSIFLQLLGYLFLECLPLQYSESVLYCQRLENENKYVKWGPMNDISMPFFKNDFFYIHNFFYNEGKIIKQDKSRHTFKGGVQ